MLLRSAGLLQSALGHRHPYIGLVLLSLGEVAVARRDHLEASSCFMQVGGWVFEFFWGAGRGRCGCLGVSVSVDMGVSFGVCLGVPECVCSMS